MLLMSRQDDFKKSGKLSRSSCCGGGDAANAADGLEQRIPGPVCGPECGPTDGTPPCCDSSSPPGSGKRGGFPLFLSLLPGLAVWAALYAFLPDLSRWATYSVLGLTPGSHLASSVEFFLLDVPKVLLLLVLIVFVVGVVQSFVSPQLTRRV